MSDAPQPKKRPRQAGAPGGSGNGAASSYDGSKRAATSDGHHGGHSAAAATTTTLQPVVANHYNNRVDGGLQARGASQILRLRNFNNWVKSCLLNEVLYPGCGVFDICSGKGGDLNKFGKANIGYYVAADHAGNSVRDSVVRYNQMNDRWPAKFFTADCHQPFVNDWLEPDIRFDVVSCQFALHYSFETEARARGLLKNVADRLKPGGYFVGTITDGRVLVDKLRRSPGNSFSNSVFSVDFETPGYAYESKNVPLSAKSFDAAKPFGNKYIFELKEVIDKCPEYLVPFTTFERLCNDVGLELVMKANFHDFFYQYRAIRDYHNLLSKMHVVDESGSLSPDEWDVCGVYMAFTFRKRDASRSGSSSSSSSSSDGKSSMRASLSPDHTLVGRGRYRNVAPLPSMPPPSSRPLSMQRVTSVDPDTGIVVVPNQVTAAVTPTSSHTLPLTAFSSNNDHVSSPATAPLDTYGSDTNTATPSDAPPSPDYS